MADEGSPLSALPVVSNLDGSELLPLLKARGNVVTSIGAVAAKVTADVVAEVGGEIGPAPAQTIKGNAGVGAAPAANLSPSAARAVLALGNVENKSSRQIRDDLTPVEVEGKLNGKAPAFGALVAVGMADGEGGEVNLSYPVSTDGTWTTDVDGGKRRRTFRTRSDGTVIVAQAFDETTGRMDVPTVPTVGGMPLRAAMGLADVDKYRAVPATAVDRTPQARLRDNALTIADMYLPTDPDFSNARDRALASGLNVFLPQREGGYLVRRGGRMAPNGQQIFSDGAYGGYFRMDASYDLASGPVLTIPASATERQAGTTNVGFMFEQPNAAGRADMIRYPWAIDARGVARTKFGGVTRIAGAWDGVNFDALRNGSTILSNCGGASIDHLEIGALNRAYYFDDLADSLHITTLKLWPFGMSDGLRYAAYSAAGGLGGYIGRVDGLDIKCIAHFRAPLTFTGRGVSTETGFGTVGAIHMDGDRSTMTFGEPAGASGGGPYSVTRCGGFYGTTSLPDETKLIVNGASLSIAGLWILGSSNPAASASLVQQNGGHLAVTGADIYGIGPNQRALEFNGGSLDWHGGIFRPYAGQARSQPLVDVRGGRATIVKPRCTDVGSGTGLAIRVVNDDWHDIDFRMRVGWGAQTPTGPLGNYVT